MEERRDWRIGLVVLAALSLVGLFLVVERLAAGPPGAGADPTRAFPVAPERAAWSPGWVIIPAGTCQVFNHNLGGDPESYAVNLWFMDLDNNMGVNRRNYGGLEVGGYWRGVYWQHLTATNIEVCRYGADMSAERVFLRVWEPLNAPDFDSGWLDIAPDETLVISHGLGITATELTAGLWFSSTARGIHHASYGGLYNDDAQELHGAYWKSLTENTIRVRREVDDTFVEQVRVVVSESATPSYDSLAALGGWQDLAFLTPFTFTHNLNWPPHLLLVRMECKSADLPGPGINQVYAGGNHDWFIGWQGAHVENVTEQALQVERRVNDQVCPQARVRIWKQGYRVFLPIALRGAPTSGTPGPPE